jgi:photosystem II stability/assembly factor-like uncharacterized protein
MAKLYSFSISFLLVLFFTKTVQAQQWERLPGPTPDYYGLAGNVTCIATNDTFVWVGTANSGIFRTDAQPFAQWQPKNSGVQTFTIYSLNYSNGLLVATTKRGVYKSVDYGNSWVAINNGLPIDKKITAFAAANGVMLAATAEYGVFGSTDNGLNWQKASNGLLDNNVLDVETDGTNFWALTLNAGLYKSTDKGQSWQHITITGGCTQCFELELVDNTIFLAGGSILVSYNGGANWSTDTTLKNIIGIAAYNGRLMAHSQYRVYESTDTGKVWLLDWEYNTDSAETVNTVLATPLDVKYIATPTNGIYRGAVAAVTWKPYNDGLVTSNANKIEWFEGALFTVAYGRFLKSTDQGNTWVDITPSGDAVNHFITQPNKKILVATDGGIYTTNYPMINWQASANFIGTQRVTKLFDMDGSFYAIADSGIYYSPLKSSINFALLANNIDTLQFTELLLAKGVLYAGTNAGLYSAADGHTFTYVNNDIPKRYVYFLREINGKVWLKVGIDTHVSADGLIWPRYYYIGGVTFANSVSVVENRIYASTTSGYMLSDTAQDLWKTIPNEAGLDANVFSKSDSFLFIGTGAGIWRFKLSDIGTGTVAPQMAKTITVYPNPATNVVWVDSDAELKSIGIYNLTGERIIECQTCENIDITKLPAGLYIIKATTPSGTFTHKFIKE